MNGKSESLRLYSSIAQRYRSELFTQLFTSYKWKKTISFEATAYERY